MTWQFLVTVNRSAFEQEPEALRVCHDPERVCVGRARVRAARGRRLRRAAGGCQRAERRFGRAAGLAERAPDGGVRGCFRRVSSRPVRVPGTSEASASYR